MVRVGMGLRNLTSLPRQQGNDIVAAAVHRAGVSEVASPDRIVPAQAAGRSATRRTNIRRGRQRMAVSFSELLDAFTFVGAGAMHEHEAFLCRQSGQNFWHSEFGGEFDARKIR
jgi:hypothetical protein